MGFYGNYYKISTGVGLEAEEQGQSSVIKFTQDVSDALGIGVDENGIITVGLAKELNAIKAELGANNPDSEFAGYTGSKIDNIETILEIEKGSNKSNKLDNIYSRIFQIENELSGTSTENGIEGSRIDLLENEVDNIIDGSIIIKNSEQLGGVNSSEYALIGNEDTDTANSLTIQGTRKHIDQSIENLNLGTMSKEDKNNYVLKEKASGYDDILTQTVAKEKYATIDSKNDLDNRLLKIENELSGTSTENGIEGSRIDLLEEFRNRTEGFATAEQGAKADAALQALDIASGNGKGTIKVKETDIAVTGLSSAAYKEENYFATKSLADEIKNNVSSIETTIGSKEISGTIKYDIEQINKTIGVYESNSSITDRLDQTEKDILNLEQQSSGVYKGELLSEAEYQALLLQDDYNTNDYWQIGGIVNEDETITTIEFNISYNVKVVTGDIIVYVSIDQEKDTKIFLKSHNVLNIVNGEGTNSIKSIAQSNIASGNGSVVFGAQNKAYGQNGLITGFGNTLRSNDKQSIVFGYYNTTGKQSSLIGGEYSDTDQNTLFALGNGDEIKRSNAILVAQNGHEYLSGDLYTYYKKDLSSTTYYRLGNPNDKGTDYYENTLYGKLDTKIDNLFTELYGSTENTSSRLDVIDTLLEFDNSNFNRIVKIENNISSHDNQINVINNKLNYGEDIKDFNRLINIETEINALNNKATWTSSAITIQDINGDNSHWFYNENKGYYQYQQSINLPQKQNNEDYIVLFDVANSMDGNERLQVAAYGISAIIDETDGCIVNIISLKEPMSEINYFVGYSFTYSYIKEVH